MANNDTVVRVRGLVVCVVVLNLLFFLYLLLALRVMSTYKRNYSVDVDTFAYNVNLAVTNFLSSYISSPGVSRETDAPPDSALEYSVSVELVDGMGFFYSPRRGYCIIIDGVVYGVGDYSPYGELVQIRSDRAYSFRSGSYVVLRSRRSDSRTPPAFDAVPDLGRDGTKAGGEADAPL